MEYVSEIHKLLGLGEDVPARIPGTPVDLPLQAPATESEPTPNFPQTEMEHASTEHVQNFDMAENKRSRIWGVLVYPLIFLVAFGFFYSILNFSAIIAQVEGLFTKPQNEVVLGEELSGYYEWISRYYFAVGDSQMLEPNNDIDGDGLSNFDEFTLRTNPTVADSDSDGYSDGIEVINQYNPWGSGRMTESQTKLAENIDLNLVNNRISFNALPSGSVSGASTIMYDLNKPGKLSIPRLNLQVPLVWSRDPAEFDQDLTKGVIHYPGTAMPGEQGTIYVSGHSSDYPWKSHPYKQVFAKLNHLQAGDDIFIELYDVSGKIYNYRYRVSETLVYSPDDQSQFVDNSANRLNLSTCWPIGTQKDRLVVSAIQIDL